MRYVCQICGYIYDDAREIIPFGELPATWSCPLCRAAKSNFRPENANPTAARPAAPPKAEADLKKLSAGQLAALCSNLARGCEKQYKETEANLFRELAEYFTSVTPAVDDPSLEALSELLWQDIEHYPGVRAATDQAFDRGAARICVWGEKVTRMLSSLTDRYLHEGEAMLADTDIWICTICGFVYIGENPPQLCPVCKVPAWKFEQIERRTSA